MADWSSYDNAELTPLRLQVTHSGKYPAQSLGSMLMADYSGSGFIAGMVKGEEVYAGGHDHGFAIDRIPCNLPSGPSEIRIKLSKMPNGVSGPSTPHCTKNKKTAEHRMSCGCSSFNLNAICLVRRQGRWVAFDPGFPPICPHFFFPDRHGLF